MALRGDEPLQVELKPTRALALACIFSSLSILVAIGFLIQILLSVSTSGGNIVLLQITVGILVTVLCSGIIVNYARLQPPQSTRLWSMAYSVVAYLAVVWLLLCSLAFVVTSNVLYPSICSKSDALSAEIDCDGSQSSLAFLSFIAIAIALLFSLFVHAILSYDLRRHLPLVRAAQEEEDFMESEKGSRQVLIIQTTYLPISQSESGISPRMIQVRTSRA